MALVPGARIGIYEVVSLIGSGGMGEVYLARDTQLGRNVALKVLPDLFASDAERLARFRREAQVLAALHHPNIAVIHGLEDADGARALVLEYIEGDTLADRIAAGRIPLDEALGIARQIAEALQAAHDQGIIHRDLKPSNIKLTPEGAVKVLDFGLAKLASTAEAASGPSSSVSLSPTITSPAATMMGIILGTAAYMAPEQAKGKPADKRSDVWAFGCVLFEMLSGKRAFEGDDISETLASVIKGEPEWNALPADVPPAITTLIRSCLTKDPRARAADISTALFVLKHQDALVDRAPKVEAPTTARRPRWGLVGAAVLAFIAVAAGSGWVGWRLQPDDPLRALVTTFTIGLPENETFSNVGRTLVAVSPDSRRVVFVAANRLNVRYAGQLDAVPVRGTEGAGVTSPRGPFFSPDGEWIAYWTANQLKRIAVNGGAATVLANVDLRGALGAHWGSDDTIVYALLTGIWRVSALTGGTPELLVKANGNRRYQHPQILPGREALLYTSTNGPTVWDEADIVIRRLKDGAETRIAVGSDARYLPSGHIAFVVRGALIAIPFDLKTLTPTGGQVALLDGVSASNNLTGAAHFDVSSTGTLAYVTGLRGGTDGGILRPVWVTRDRREEALGAEDRSYLYLRLSPDQTRVVFDVQGENRDIHVWDVGQRAMRRLTTSTEADRMPIFTRDSRRIIYSSDVGGLANLFWQSADGVGGVHRLTQAAEVHFAMSTAPDDTVLVRVSSGGGAGSTADIYQLPLGGDRKLTKLIGDDFLEQNAEVSHKGQWIAYQTDRSGRNDVLVRPYPANNAEFPVSTAGGTEPLWSADDSELFYRSPTGAIMRVKVKPGQTWNAGPPEQVLPGEGLRLGILGSPYRTYDVSRDGRRFLVLKEMAPPDARGSTARIVVVENFFETLRRRVPAK